MMTGFPHDASYKALLSHKEMMTQLALGYLQDDLTGEIDWDSLELVPTEHITGRLERRVNDLIWSLRRRRTDGEGEEWVFIFAMLEFQSSPDHYMAVRMMTYIGAFYEAFIAHERLSQETKLPVIYPLVIYNGQREWNTTCDLDDLLQPSGPGLKKYRPALQFKLLQAWHCEEARTERNLVESIFRIERSGGLEAAGQVMDELVEVFAGGEYEQVDRTFAKWLTAHIGNRYPDREIPACTSVKEVRMKVIDELLPWGQHQLERDRKKAAAEGRVEGRAEGRAEVLAMTREEVLAEERAEALAEVRAKGRQEVLPMLRRSLTQRSRDRFGEGIARILRSEIESTEDLGDLDRIMGWIDSCESGETLLSLVQAR